MQRVPLTEAEIEFLGPIIDRWEQAQKDGQIAQRDVDAAIKLCRAQHATELTDGPEWQLARDAWVRPLPPLPPPAPSTPPQPQAEKALAPEPFPEGAHIAGQDERGAPSGTGMSGMNDDEVNGSVEEVVAGLMEG